MSTVINRGHDSPNGVRKRDVLIVDAGPTGASLACFLSTYGMTGIMISRARGTADTPWAHITNMAALECLRDIGLDKEVVNVASEGHCMEHTRWCHSMAGEEYARVYSWGNDLARIGDYVAASPCKPVDIPQVLLEPVLVRYATSQGFTYRFETSFVRLEDPGEDGIITTLRDDVSKTQWEVHSKYLFGADSARSRVVKHLDLPLTMGPEGRVAINVLVDGPLASAHPDSKAPCFLTRTLDAL